MKVPRGLNLSDSPRLEELPQQNVSWMVRRVPQVMDRRFGGLKTGPHMLPL
jgi:hypothetical protein